MAKTKPTFCCWGSRLFTVGIQILIGATSDIKMPGWKNPWPILGSLPVAAKTGKRHRMGRWEKRVSRILSTTEHRGPCSQAQEPSAYISTPIPLATTIPLSSLQLAFFVAHPPPHYLDSSVPHCHRRIYHISVATIGHDKGSDIPTNASVRGT